MHYEFDLSVIWNNWPFLLSGAVTAVSVTAMALVLCLPIAITVALCRLSRHRLLRIPATLYVAVFRNTPALVQLIWFYYCLPILLGIEMQAMTSCTLALTVSAAGYMAEIIRGGIQGVDSGQIEAARTIGLTYFQTLRKVVFPQALRRMIAPTVNEIVTLLKFSSLLSVLGIADLTYQAQVLASNTFRPIEIYTFLGLEYLLICSLVSLAARRIEQRLAASER